MTAHGSGMETVLLGGEVGRDEGKDICWNAVDMGKEVLPLANGRQRDRNILVELGDRLQSEAAEVVSARFLK